MNVKQFTSFQRVPTGRGNVPDKVSFVVGVDGCARIDVEPGLVTIEFESTTGRPADTFLLTPMGYSVVPASRPEEQAKTAGKKGK